MFALTAILSLLLLLQPSLAKVYCTGPTASTVGVGGQVLTVTWADDGSSPTVAEIGQSSIDLYVGSVDKQTALQNLAASVDVSKASSVSATVNPTIGESGNYYFVKFTSLSLKDSTNPQYNYEAFSAKFQMSEMSGQFNATVLSEIDASNSTTTAATSGAAAVAAVGASSAAHASSTSSSHASVSTSSKTTTSGALSTVAVPGLMAVVLGVAGILFA
ncbi:hypothetical protein BCR39DRAFT_109548 [Naematelia encephala]|uniref:Yeast cell wall synthesis Kre9/Knh1-like N-terminal domain-containing protein n=1 Tax=Naematelia encephala TaxID=71784 RepID=A0A1Y2B6V2_9TREE|nr:hypothetical protein BCR39DRAFT_109548 [Naematelia encephala]